MNCYARHYGWDENARDRYRDHPCFDSCATFCERRDQASFDPAHHAPPLSHFGPMLRAVFARKSHDPDVIGEGYVSPIVAA